MKRVVTIFFLLCLISVLGVNTQLLSATRGIKSNGQDSSREMFSRFSLCQMITKKRNLRYLFNLCILTLLLVGMGCRSGPKLVVEPVPGWLKSIPKDEKYYYAIGISGATRRAADAWDQAIKRARAELGRLIVSHITSHNTIISTTHGEYVRELVEILSDTELNYTEVIGRWVDRAGVYGASDHYYVLVRMEKRVAESVLRRIK